MFQLCFTQEHMRRNKFSNIIQHYYCYFNHMFTYKFYVKMSKNNTLLLRITNNRKKAELALSLRISEEEFTDILSGSPSQRNLTRGNRHESAFISTDPEIFANLHAQVNDLITNHSVPLHDLFRQRPTYSRLRSSPQSTSKYPIWWSFLAFRLMCCAPTSPTAIARFRKPTDATKPPQRSSYIPKK